MSRIDKRLKTQRFKNQNGLNDVYVWKQGTKYEVGINGTSRHFGNLSHAEAEIKVSELIRVKN